MIKIKRFLGKIDRFLYFISIFQIVDSKHIIQRLNISMSENLLVTFCVQIMDIFLCILFVILCLISSIKMEEEISNYLYEEKYDFNLTHFLFLILLFSVSLGILLKKYDIYDKSTRYD